MGKLPFRISGLKDIGVVLHMWFHKAMTERYQRALKGVEGSGSCFRCLTTRARFSVEGLQGAFCLTAGEEYMATIIA